MDVWLGTINTGVLLTSSLTMALAVHATYNRNQKKLVQFLIATIVLGVAFLGVKAYEYHHKFEERHIPFLELPFEWDGEQQGVIEFFNLYFLMTGMHAFHMLIGLAFLGGMAWMAIRGRLLDHPTLVHNIGLYWHFVDLVWVYLFPFFYLVAARGGAPTGGH